MSIWQAILLAVVQSLTEFIPVSSSAHLVILPHILKIPQPSLFLDVSLHFGTLLSLLVYFRQQIFELLKKGSPSRGLLKYLLVATLPAAIAGALANDFFESFFQKPFWAAVFLIFTGILLFLAERLATFKKNSLKINYSEALIIGLAQALAIFPGISRSGATISAGLFLGLKREEAARFSFLLGIPIIFGSFLFELKKVSFSTTAFFPLILGVLVSFITGYLIIDFLLKYLKQRKLYPFAAYCFLVGLISAWWLR